MSITARKAGSIIRSILKEMKSEATCRAREVSFADLARDSKVFVYMENWRGNVSPVQAQILTVASKENEFILNWDAIGIN